MPELSPSAPGGEAAPPWRRFLEQRFPNKRERDLLRRALRRTFNQDEDRPTRVFLVGPSASGKSALLHLVARCCRAGGVPAPHVGFTHVYGEEPACGPSGESLVSAPAQKVPTVLWAGRQDDPLGPAPAFAKTESGREVIYIDMRSEVVERTASFPTDVSTLDVLTWLAESAA